MSPVRKREVFLLDPWIGHDKIVVRPVVSEYGANTPIVTTQELGFLCDHERERLRLNKHKRVCQSVCDGFRDFVVRTVVAAVSIMPDSAGYCLGRSRDVVPLRVLKFFPAHRSDNVVFSLVMERLCLGKRHFDHVKKLCTRAIGIE